LVVVVSPLVEFPPCVGQVQEHFCVQAFMRKPRQFASQFPLFAGPPEDNTVGSGAFAYV
jgi:hypothetical protein